MRTPEPGQTARGREARRFVRRWSVAVSAGFDRIVPERRSCAPATAPPPLPSIHPPIPFTGSPEHDSDRWFPPLVPQVGRRARGGGHSRRGSGSRGAGAGRRAAARLRRDVHVAAQGHARDAGRPAAGQRPRHPHFQASIASHRRDVSGGRSRDGKRARAASLFNRGEATRLYSSNETDRVGPDKGGTVSSFAVDRADGKLEPLSTVRVRRRGADPRQPAPVRPVPVRGQLFRRLRRGPARSSPTAASMRRPTSRPTPARSARPRRPTPPRAASPSAVTTGRMPT